MEIEEIKKDKRITQFFKDHWGGEFIVSRDECLHGHELDGFAIFDNEKIIGLLTYHFRNDECEIVTLDSLWENQGMGTKLIEKLIEKVKADGGCNRVWLMTTNDNTDSMRFYQKRGFVFKAIHINAIEKSRKLKQVIPEFGDHDIPIRDEVEMEFIIE